MSFPGTGKIWMNGSLVDWADAKIHIASHVVHYGSAVFEGARCYSTPNGSACFRLDAHMRRLYDSAKIYRMEPEVSEPALTEAVLATIRANEFKACYIRPIVYRGYEALGVNPFPCPIDIAILTWEWGAYLGDDALEQGVDARISSWARAAPNTFPTLAKSSANYANSQLIKMEAIVEGYSEGIALDTNGQISEGSGQNLFLVRDEVLYTPPLSAAVLPGITRNSILQIARDLGFKIAEEPASPRAPLHFGRGVLRRHRSRGHADPIGGQGHDRSRQSRPDHRGHPESVLRHRQRRGARPAWLAEVRVPRGAAPDRWRRRRGRCGDRSSALSSEFGVPSPCTSTIC